jgi:hypothetical protein
MIPCIPSIIALLLAVPAWAAPLDFNRDVRPILSENCFYCHGQDPNKREADLRLDVREDAVKAKAFVPGDPAMSDLVERIFSTDKDDMMPPPKSHRVLTVAQKETLKRWIAEGANYAPHWAFVAPSRPEPPAVKAEDWVKNPIDRFVLAKLETERLPPKPEEVDAFVADTAPDAYSRLVERMLASPHYGERMALPWFDAARYADSNGFQQDGDTFQWMWRDWVVKALNADMPFDQFSIEQLAGDLLPKATQEQKIATAFNRNHLLNGEGGAIPEEQRFVNLFDRVDTTSTTWLGLTMACAQCHDHKYDPITQRDYYGMLALFNQVSENGLAGGGPSRFRIASPAIDIHTEETRARLAELEKARTEAETSAQSKSKFDLAYAAWKTAVVPETPELSREITPILRTEKSKRTEEEKKKLESRLRSHFVTKVWPKVAEKDASVKAALAAKNEVDQYRNETVPRVMVMADDRKRDTHLLDRGDYEAPKEKVDAATPAFLPQPSAKAPLNRLGFARWLFQPDHPLTARVQMNRMWQHFFGTGIVSTSEDLGVQSEFPLHLALLDWLAVEFREKGWRQKEMVRLIVNSATYRQGSRVSTELLTRDPNNRLYARASRFRSPSMVLRDVALAASGLLDSRIGGAPVYPYQPDAIWETLAITKERDFTYPQSKGADLYRRSLYTFWRRTIGPANMFDASNRQTCKVRSSATSTPLHALTTLNDPTWAEAARVLAQHAIESAPDTATRVTWAFRRVLGRKPKAEQIAMLERAYEKQLAIYQQEPQAAEKLRSIGEAPKASQLDASIHAAMSAVCLAIFNLDQALTRE